MADKPSIDPADAAAQITRTGSTWSSGLGQATTVTYGFRTGGPTYPNADAGGYSQFSATQIQMAELALAGWRDVANITFTRVGTGYSDSASILFGNYSTGLPGAAAFAYMPYDGSTSSRHQYSPDGDVWINNTFNYSNDPTLYKLGLLHLAHETGHAIGLSHFGDYDKSAPSYSADAEFLEDTHQYSIMSYFKETYSGANYYGLEPAAPQLFDIAAAQRLYGANMTTRTGDTTYGFNSTADRPWFSVGSASAPIIFAVWDAGGKDTFDFSGYSQAQKIDLQQGHFSNVGALIGNVSIAQGVVIENAFGGSGADAMTGNAAANLLKGNGGADTLLGLNGADSLDGGAGADTLDGGLGSDTAVFSGAAKVVAGLGTGQATIGGVVDTLIAIENLTGGSAGDSLIGDALSNVLAGAEGGDSLKGGGGKDTLTGSIGADLLNGGKGGDQLDGGSDNDVFTYLTIGDSKTKVSARDFVLGLQNGDVLDLSAIDADATQDGDQAFILVDGEFTAAGQMRLEWHADTGETLLVASVDTDKKAEMVIRIDGDHDDFVNFLF